MNLGWLNEILFRHYDRFFSSYYTLNKYAYVISMLMVKFATDLHDCFISSQNIAFIVIFETPTLYFIKHCICNASDLLTLIVDNIGGLFLQKK